ncbi:MAG: ribosome small subunit-dependent GTPase A [Spirochaetales bacterium]|nr:ribosome small subunit-dependent GTPase A [Spirochaetales bacterium]
MIGLIYSGINNIYQVRPVDGGDDVAQSQDVILPYQAPTESFYECRIKGKILKDSEPSYNPLAPGDLVVFEPSDEGQGLIHRRLERTNRFARWNRKRENWQTVAANLDLLVAVVAAGKPPFRPRFVDRVLIAAAQGGVKAAVLVNKIDQGLPEWGESRISAWEELDIPVYRSSAHTGEGMEEIRALTAGKTVALFGPSGVGKSSVLNRLLPHIELATGGLSEKYDRGRHVTNFGRLLDAPWGARLVDTPGVREILVRGMSSADLIHWFPEFSGLDEECSYSPCSHRHEPDCAVQDAVDDGRIHPDRFENYLRIRDELEEDERW